MKAQTIRDLSNPTTGTDMWRNVIRNDGKNERIMENS